MSVELRGPRWAPLLLVAACAAPLRLPDGGPAWTARFAADTIRVAEPAPGVRHVYLWLGDGPWAVHVVEIEERVCRPEVAALKAGPPLAERARTSELGSGAIAAINADFFMMPGGTPVGPHVRNGRVLVGPGGRPALTIDPDGRHRAGPATLRAFTASGADTALLGHVNRIPGAGAHHAARAGILLYDEWFGDTAPSGSPGSTLRVRKLPRALPDPARERWDRGVVIDMLGADSKVSLDSVHVALRGLGEQATAWVERRSHGDTVSWSVAGSVDAGPPAAEAVGGFPVLVEGGRPALSKQEGVIPSFGGRRHPRTAVGWDEPDRRLLWVVVDGRSAPYSDGMTLSELEWLLLGLGVTHAINLDGGGSTALVVRGAVANRPSDAGGERAVANALVLESCRPPTRR